MKKISLAVISVLLVLLACVPLSAGQQRVVRVGAFNYYPGIFKDTDGIVKGFYVDALTELGALENIRFEYVYGSWSEGLERIKTGQVDMLTSVAYTPERAEFLDYTKTPLLTVWGELYVPLVSDLDGIREVEGKKIALMKSDVNARHFIDLTRKFGIVCEFVELPGFDDVFKAVASKKVDAGVVNSTYGTARQRDFGLRSTGVVFNPFDIYFAVAKGQNRDLLVLLEKNLVDWRHLSDSPYNRARQKWSHGTAGTMQVIPRWVTNSAAALGMLFLIAAGFIILLRRQVRKATSEIADREARFRSYIDSSPEGIFIANENGRYVEVNPAACRITGYSEAELLRKHIHEILPPESVQPALQSFNLLKQQGSSGVELEFLHKSGSRQWWSVEAVKLSEARYLGFVKDISEQKWLEQTQVFLAQCGYRHPQDDFFKSLAAYLSEILEMEFVCIDRLLGDRLTARTLAVYHNGIFEDNVEYALKDTPCGDVVGNQVCCFPERVVQLFPNDPVLQDLKAESYIGVTLWDHNGRPIGLIAVIGRTPLKSRPRAEAMMKLVAIRAAGELERLDTEAALRSSEEKFKAMAETIPVAIYLSSGIEQVSQYFNPTMTKLFGYSIEDIPTVGHWWPLAYPDEFYRRQFSEEWNRRVERAIETQSSIEPMEVVVTCKDGSRKNILWGFITLGESNYAYGLDLTERKQVEEEIRRKNTEIEQFIYTVSHDLRSPLVTVKTFLGYLLQDISAGDSEHITKDIDFIDSATTRMEALLNELLEMSRIGRVINPPETVTFQEIASEALDALAGQITSGRVDIRVSTADTALCGDRRRLLQIWQNLLDNAIKYMGDQTQPLIEISVGQQGDETVFTVCDNGIGIEPEYHEKIFGIFEQLDRSKDGVGMGLTMVRRIVEMYGGRIWVDSRGEKRGACFHFTLPAAMEKNRERTDT